MSQPQKQKLYCFVDETGQDSHGMMFLVAVVITREDTVLIRSLVETIERASGKGSRKWFRTNNQRRLAYITQVLTCEELRGKIHLARFANDDDYRSLTVQATAEAILDEAAGKPYEAHVFIDGLNRAEEGAVAGGLHRRRITIRKVRGLVEQADALIRLADANAGFGRDAQEGNEEFQKLYEQAIRHGQIKEAK